MALLECCQKDNKKVGDTNDLEQLISSDNDTPHKPWVPQRYILSALLMLGGCVAATMRGGFIIAMVNLLNITQNMNDTSDECPIPTDVANVTQSTHNGYLNYDKGVILGCFYYGYTFFTQVLGGILSERIGTRKVLSFSVFTAGLVYIFIPRVIDTFYAVVILMAFVGVFQGPLFPSIYVYLGRWAPPGELARMAAVVTTGINLGTFMSPPIAGLLCSSTFLGGWPMVFYIFGSCGMIWGIVWFIYSADTPEKHKWLSPYERQYIMSETQKIGSVKYPIMPLGKLLKSVPFWALLFIMLTDGMGGYVLQSFVPVYMKQILRFDIAENGLLSGMPYLVFWLMSIFVVSPLTDWILKACPISLNVQRKLFTVIAEVGVGLLVIAVGYVECDHVFAVSLLVTSFAVYAFNSCAFALNTLDIAPIYSGTIMGIVNGLNNLFGFVSPEIALAFTQGLPSRSKYQHLFWMTGGVFISGALVFTIFGSVKELDWAKDIRTQHVQHKDVIDTKIGESDKDENQTIINQIE